MQKNIRFISLSVFGLVLFSFFIAGWPLQTQAAPLDCGDLFISEYIEGSSFNKAIEIYNGTGASVDLSTYELELYSNGAATPSQSITLSGSVADGDVMVLSHGSAVAAIQAETDITSSSVINFNGDDAVVLRHNDAIIDVIGQVGFDPGTQWGSGDTSTLNHTLERQITIGAGDTNANDAFDPSLEWGGFAEDTFDGLGSHTTTSCDGGDSAPSVSSTTPTNNGSNILVGANLTVNFSENVNATGAWYNISCTSSGTHTAVVSGGPQSFTLNPDSDFVMNETCTATVYAAQVNDQDIEDPPDLMNANYVWSFTTEGSPAPCSTIPLIQGTGNTTACLGHRNDIEGCITGVSATGFYFQDVTGDGNPTSSDGIFAYFWSTWNNPSNLQVGDLVSVSGNVTEYYDTTEFAHSGSDSLSISTIGSCSPPAPVSIAPNLDPTADPMTLYERYEGMRVQMSFDGWVVGPTKRFDSRYVYGDPEIAFVDFSSTISDYSRVFQSDYPGYQGINYLSGGLNFDLPELDFGADLAGTNIIGVLGYQFDKYTLLVDTAPTLVTVDNPSSSTPQIAADSTKFEFDFCFYNVENLFDNLNDGSGDWGDWAPGWPTPGTPEGAAEYQSHLNENVAVLYNDAKSCMVIGLSEVEGNQVIYDDLATALSTLDAVHTWTGIYVESGDSRDITQGFLYREDVVLLSGPTPVSGSPYTTWVSDNALDFRRVPAAAEFQFFTGTDAEVEITAYAVHFKSKRASTSCSTDDCTDVRELEAADLRDILEYHQGTGEYAVAGGDFNDYITSSPISILTSSASVYNLFDDLPTNDQYSFIFSGESEVLDYIFVTQNMLTAHGYLWDRAFAPIHVNADFPASEHASDHDPVRVRFLGSDLSDSAASYGEAWHTIPHLIWLGSSVSNDPQSTPEGDNASDTGVSIYSGTWSPGQTVTIRVETASEASYPETTAWFSGWFDWDLNGTFDLGERTINQAVNIGQTDITFTVPVGAQIGIGGVENSSMPVRFRLYESTVEPLSAPFTPLAAELSGGAAGGEVEDYVWEFTPTAVTLKSFGTQISDFNWITALILIAGFSGFNLWVLAHYRKEQQPTENSS